LRVTVAGNAAVVGVPVERLSAQLAVRSGRVLATVDTVTAVTGQLKQFIVEVALVRLAAAVACYAHIRTCAPDSTDTQPNDNRETRQSDRGLRPRCCYPKFEVKFIIFSVTKLHEVKYIGLH